MDTRRLKFDANISILFGNLPLLERPAAAAAAGFDAVESWWPWRTPVPAAREVDAFCAALADAGVRLVGLNFFEGDMRAGDRGLASSPARVAQFRENVPVAADIARRTGCRVLNALYGNREEGAGEERQDELARESLVIAAQAAHRAGASVGLEAISRWESPYYPLPDARTAVAAVDAVNAATGLGNAGFICDLYHHGRSGEDLPAVLDRHIGQIIHFQIADTPGRGRPGTGVIDYPDLFARIAAAGYTGWIGLEYEPTYDVRVDFDWLRDSAAVGAP